MISLPRIPYIHDMSEWEKSFSFCCPVKVRFSDTDAFGHVNNTKVFLYLEEARVEFFNKLGLMKTWANPKTENIIVTLDAHCHYLKQMFFGEQLKVYVKINHIGNTSVDLHYMIKNENDEICLTSRGLIVQVAKSTGKSVPWSEETKEKFKKYLS